MKQKQSLLLLLALAATLATGWWVRNQGQALTIKPGASYGIVSLELAWNRDAVFDVLKEWQGPLADIARKNIYIDFLFLLAYSWFLSLACKFLGERNGGIFSNWGEKLSKLMLTAGALDAAENALMLLTLNGDPNNHTALATAIFAVCKFLIVIVGILFIVVAGLRALVAGRR
jgi:hypothetical protein